MDTNVSEKPAASIFRVKGSAVSIVRLHVQVARNLNIQTHGRGREDGGQKTLIMNLKMGQHVPLKCWYPHTILLSVPTQKAMAELLIFQAILVALFIHRCHYMLTNLRLSQKNSASLTVHTEYCLS
jgi:hypothetical protein